LTLDARGLTLAEVVAAAMIVGIGLAGLMIVVPIGSFGLAEGNQLTTATFLAEERLEHVRNALWTSSPDNDCVGIGPMATLAAGDVTFGDEPSVAAPYTSYARTVRIQDCASTPCTGITTAGMRQVTVTISYRPLTAAGVAASDKSVTLTMLVAQR